MHRSWAFVIGTCFCSFFVQGECAQTLTYQSKTAGKVREVQWEVQDDDEQFLVSGKTLGSNVAMTLSQDFSFLEYEEQSKPRRDFSIKRRGSTLFLKGTKLGKKIVKTYSIGQDYWVQEFNFGLRPLLNSPKKTMTFHIISPKDFAIHELVATKEGEEVIQVGESEYVTEKVKITLTGFKKRFWKGLIWFDKERNVLVRYKANEGPGTPYTETTLLEAEK